MIKYRYNAKLLCQKVLGMEFSLPLYAFAGRHLNGIPLVQSLCFHAGEGVRNRAKVRVHLTPRGFRLVHDLSDHTLRHLFFGGDYEPELTDILVRCAKPGQTWWDIGANIGWFTLLLSQLVGDEGHVVSFEPNPQIATWLHRALEINRVGNVAVHQIALSNQDGEATLFLPAEVNATDGGHGRPSLVRYHDIEQQGICETRVKVRTIDSLIEREVPVPFGIKMDVEGFESAVLSGGSLLFKHSPPAVLLCEVNHRPECLSTPAQLVQQIVNLGYEAWHVENGQKYILGTPIDGSWSKDFLFVHIDRASEILPSVFEKS